MLIQSAGARDWRKYFFDDLRVSLNGETVEDVVEADDEAGYIVRYCRDTTGKLVVDRDRYKTERVEGKVEFVGAKRFSPDDARAAAQAKRERRAARNLRNATAQGLAT